MLLLLLAMTIIEEFARGQACCLLAVTIRERNLLEGKCASYVCRCTT